MYSKIYLFTILTFFIATDAKKVKPVPSHPYIFNLELKFDEDKLDDFMVDSFFATANPESNKALNCDVTLNDIIKAIPTKKLTTTDFIAAFDELDLSLNDDDVTNFVANLNYADLNSMGFATTKVYKNIMKTYFKDRPADLLESLEILGIAPEFSVAYTFGTDEDVFNVFRSANLSRYNLVEIRNIINTTTTVKDLTNVLGLKKINQLYVENFINTKVSPFLLERGLTEESLLAFLKSFPLSLSNYKNSKLVKTCYNSLTKYKSIAVAVSQNEILINDDSLISKYLNLEKYTTLSVETVENALSTYSISADNINGNESDNIIRIKIDGNLPSFIEETTTYGDLANYLCNYITIEDDVLVIQNAVPQIVNDQLTITKSYNTFFKKGSPIICGEKLYGLAAIDKINTIVFDRFEEDQAQEVEPLPEHPNISDAIKELLENLGSINLCKYLSCGNVNNVQEESSDENENQNVEATVENEPLAEDAVTSGDELVENDNDATLPEDENQISDDTGNSDADTEYNTNEEGNNVTEGNSNYLDSNNVEEDSVTVENSNLEGNNVEEGSVTVGNNNLDSNNAEEDSAIVETNNLDSNNAEDDITVGNSDNPDSDLISEQSENDVSQNENVISEHDTEDQLGQHEDQSEELYSRENATTANNETEIEAEQTENVNSSGDNETDIAVSENINNSLGESDQNQRRNDNLFQNINTAATMNMDEMLRMTDSNEENTNEENAEVQKERK